MFLLNVLLALIWVVLTGQFTPTDFAIGFLLSYLLLWRVAGDTAGTAGSSYFVKVRQVIGFLIFVLVELVKANLEVASDVLGVKRKMEPGVVAIPLDARSDLEILVLSNLITMTPGSLSLDISADRRVMYLHTMYMGDEPDKLREEIKTRFERRVLEVLR